MDFVHCTKFIVHLGLSKVILFCLVKLAATPSPFIYFVVPPGKTIEECLHLKLGKMFRATESRRLNVSWINDSSCRDQALRDDGAVFVFDPFGSPGFNYCVTQLSSTFGVGILGPHVLRQAFKNPTQYRFETGEHPIYTLAMRGMVVCLSGFKRSLKEELHKMVRWMNGKVERSLTKAVTHVMTSNAWTPKCFAANKEKIPLMVEGWIRKVWEDSQSLPVDARDPRYAKFACPLFYNVNFCLSRLTVEKENSLSMEIEKNGGQCSTKVSGGMTNILVVPTTHGINFEEAQNRNVKYVTCEWVERCIEKQCLLSPDTYTASSGIRLFTHFPVGEDCPVTSTPADLCATELNVPSCSPVVGDNEFGVEASALNYNHSVVGAHLDTLTHLRAIATRGPYLDGCNVYLTENETNDELEREINDAGATVLSELREGVTHVVVCDGENLSNYVRDKIENMESRAFIVTTDWLLQSAKDGRPADGKMFKFDHEKIMRGETVNGALVFSSKTPIGVCPSPTTVDVIGDASSGLFVGITFKVAFENVQEQNYVEGLITLNGGKLVDSDPHVMILPPIWNPSVDGVEDLSFTKFWLFAVLEKNSLSIENSFCHVPLESFTNMSKVMRGVVVAISHYQSSERSYIMEVVSAMGGRCQDALSKPNDENVPKLTHLVCKNMETNKARAAKILNKHLVVANWVVDSFNAKRRLDEKEYVPRNIWTDVRTIFNTTSQSDINEGTTNKVDETTSSGYTDQPAREFEACTCRPLGDIIKRFSLAKNPRSWSIGENCAPDSPQKGNSPMRVLAGIRKLRKRCPTENTGHDDSSNKQARSLSWDKKETGDLVPIVVANNNSQITADNEDVSLLQNLTTVKEKARSGSSNHALNLLTACQRLPFIDDDKVSNQSPFENVVADLTIGAPEKTATRLDSEAGEGYVAQEATNVGNIQTRFIPRRMITRSLGKARQEEANIQGYYDGEACDRENGMGKSRVEEHEINGEEPE